MSTGVHTSAEACITAKAALSTEAFLLPEASMLTEADVVTCPGSLLIYEAPRAALCASSRISATAV